MQPGTIDIATTDSNHLIASGDWVTSGAASLENAVLAIEQALPRGEGKVALDVSRIEGLDVAGAWLLYRLLRSAREAGRDVDLIGLSDSGKVLLEEVIDSAQEPAPPRREPPYLVKMLGDIGEGTLRAYRDMIGLTALFGSTSLIMLRLLLRPSRLRPIAILHHLEFAGVRAIPIVVLISMVIGAIIAQQGAFQLRKFGAETFSVDLVAILTLREISVLITSIMVAGRSGSAFTAEIGSMKMREEVDAMRVLALDPIEVLVVPRIIALMIAVPVLTLVSDFSALFGAGLVSWGYIDMPPEAYISYLRIAVAENTFWVGIIKAPFMAMLIGMIACREGLNVGGSAESLGRRTTTAVVKSIFIVIVLDGIFAMFFSAIDY